MNRVEIKDGKRGTTSVFIVCDDSKQVLPVYGLDRSGARALAQLLTDMSRMGISLPKVVDDQTTGG